MLALVVAWFGFSCHKPAPYARSGHVEGHCGTPSTASGIDLTSGLIAYYPLDGTASDVTGHGFDGDIVKAQSVAGRQEDEGGGLAFDGVSSHVDIQGLGDTLGTISEITIALWARTDATAGNFAVMFWPDDTFNRLVVSPNYNHNGENALFWEFGNSNEAGVLGVVPFEFTPDWRHYVVTSSVKDDRLALYVDGVFDSEVAGALPLTTTGRVLTLGGNGTNTTYYLKGALDDVVIYDHALDAAQVDELFRMGLYCN